MNGSDSIDKVQDLDDENITLNTSMADLHSKSI